jgi:hypothetical protein
MVIISRGGTNQSSMFKLTSRESISPVPVMPSDARLRLPSACPCRFKQTAACFSRLLQDELVVGRLILVPHLL